MWYYLRKYKNNHAKNSLPPETCSNASTDARIWESRRATLNPLNWHCYRFTLGHHLFNHRLSPYDEKEAQLIFPRHASVQAQTSTATPLTHPLFMLPFTLLEPTNQIKKSFPDKSSGPSGITNQMLQSGDDEFQSLLLLLFNGIWESHVQPTDWQLSLMQPIYMGHDKDKTDPASCRGKYHKDSDTSAKLFEGLLLARLTTHTELDNTLTSNQLGTKPYTQTHDAIYSLISTIQYNKYTLQKPTYVAFVDYSTAYPSVHRDRLLSILLHKGIVGQMWHHLRGRIDNIRLRVLHPNIQEHQTVDILRGLPEGSCLIPTLFGIFVADLIHELQTKFPHAVINLAPSLQHNGTTQIWISGLLHVDDLALMSTCPRELQAMLHVSVRNRMQINTQKTKVMAFFETPSL